MHHGSLNDLGRFIEFPRSNLTEKIIEEVWTHQQDEIQVALPVTGTGSFPFLL
jgi:hypothetical protein